MIDFTKTVRGILKRKNAIIRQERERATAAETQNRILAAYIAFLASDNDGITIPKTSIGAIIGKYKADVSSDGENYFIRIENDPERLIGKGERRGGKRI